jgi:hypothetical protein
MKRYFESLCPSDPSIPLGSVRDGVFLVRVVHARYRWHRRNPFYEIRFAVLKPKHLLGTFIASRLDCAPKDMWKLSWFLREFGYDDELLRRGEIDDQALVDLWGVIKVSHAIVRGVTILQLDAFSSADRWEESGTACDQAPAPSEVTS